MAKSIFERLYPDEEKRKQFTIRQTAHLPYLVRATAILDLVFLVFGVLLLVLGKPVGAAALVLFLVLSVAVVQIKKGNVQAGSRIVSVVLFLLSFAVVFFGSKTTTPFVIYRSGFIMCAMAAFNLAISSSHRQVIGFSIASAVMYLVYTFVGCAPYFAVARQETISVYAISLMGIMTTNIGLICANMYNNRVITSSEKEREVSQATLEKITRVLEESKEGLNVGIRLNKSTETAADGIRGINDIYAYILKETDHLNGETDKAEGAGTKVSGNALEMQRSVDNLSGSITQISSSMTEISANLTNVTQIANKRKEGMNAIVHELNDQLALSNELLQQVSELQDSSRKISEFVSTIDSIASQTGLLAMNASIEAAHAGTLGKGFSVIAQEIRKLSAETTNSAEKIGDTLTMNNQIVQSTAESMHNFAEKTRTNSEEMKTTILGIEEILAGISEMDLGTREVMNAITDAVDESGKTSELVSGVTSEIGDQGQALTSISSITSGLKQQIDMLREKISDVHAAIDIIQKEASDNVVVSERIASSLE